VKGHGFRLRWDFRNIIGAGGVPDGVGAVAVHVPGKASLVVVAIGVVAIAEVPLFVEEASAIPVIESANLLQSAVVNRVH
jgi:hypothetical protein